MQSLDGYIEGPGGDLSWHNVDEEYNDFSITQLNTADTLLFGRRTYELMQNFWTTEQAFQFDPVVAQKMNTMHKIVCSSTQQQFNWINTCWLGENIEQGITQLKNQQGKNILIFGSAQLAASLTNLNLIDEFHIILNPVYLGSGKTLFSLLPKQVHLELEHTEEFVSGKLLLRYNVLKQNPANDQASTP